MLEPRVVFEEGSLWFPVEELVGYKLTKPCGKIATGFSSWLNRNLPEGSVRKLPFKRTTSKRGGKLLCVNSDNIKIVGMYQKHIEGGGDFRAKWADLPDSPSFDTNIKWELSWRNAYKWSKPEHIKNSGIDVNQLAEIRKVHLLYSELIHPQPEKVSFKEAKRLLKEHK